MHESEDLTLLSPLSVRLLIGPLMMVSLIDDGNRSGVGSLLYSNSEPTNIRVDEAISQAQNVCGDITADFC